MITATTERGRQIQRVRDGLVKANKPDGAEKQAAVRTATAAIHKAFLRQRFLIIAAILGGEEVKGLRVQHKKLDILRRLRDSIATPVTAAVRAGLGLGMTRTEKDLVLSLSFNLRNQVAEDYVKTVAAQRITGITIHTRNTVRRILADGLATGATPREIADRIYAQSGGRGGIFSRERATLIANQEVGQAYEHAHMETAKAMGKQLGLKQEHEWLTSGGPRVCSLCLSAEGDGWIPIDQAFSNGFDAPLAHVGCQCSAVVRVVD